MTHNNWIFLSAVGLALVGFSTQADLIDHLDDLTNLSTPGGSVGATLADNGGSGTMTATASGQTGEQIFDWQPGAVTFFSLTTENIFNVTPEAGGIGNSGFYNVVAEYFDAGDTFVNSQVVVVDTGSTAFQSININLGAPVGATQWRARFRLLDDSGDADPAGSRQFSFDKLEAIPEPASLTLLGLAFLILGAHKRNKQ